MKKFLSIVIIILLSSLLLNCHKRLRRIGKWDLQCEDVSVKKVNPYFYQVCGCDKCNFYHKLCEVYETGTYISSVIGTTIITRPKTRSRCKFIEVSSETALRPR